MWRRIDVLLVPTAPTHYTREQMRADPVALNRNLGAYTNFVNLLDYAALSVPEQPARRRPAVRHHADRALRQRPGSWPTWASATTTPPASAGRDGHAAAAPQPIPGCAAESRPLPSPWSARTSRACR
jgi:hypothetical protein